jgi:hypothetical protein
MVMTEPCERVTTDPALIAMIEEFWKFTTHGVVVWVTGTVPITEAPTVPETDWFPEGENEPTTMTEAFELPSNTELDTFTAPDTD